MIADVTERRSAFVYEGARLQAAAVDAPIVPEQWEAREPAFRAQFREKIRELCDAPELPTPVWLADHPESEVP